MNDEALGLIEVIGLLAAVEAADTGLKAANVSLLGIENATGAYMTVKLGGDVGAVKAAVAAARVSAEKVGRVVSVHVIPRPAKGLRSQLIAEKEASVEDMVHKELGVIPAEDEEKPEAAKEESVKEEAADAINEMLDRPTETKTEELEKELETELETDLIEEEVPENGKKPAYTCNLCKDPKCPREKGQMEKLCIHARGKRGSEV